MLNKGWILTNDSKSSEQLEGAKSRMDQEKRADKIQSELPKQHRFFAKGCLMNSINKGLCIVMRDGENNLEL